jgi:hypothetical protein
MPPTSAKIIALLASVLGCATQAASAPTPQAYLDGATAFADRANVRRFGQASAGYVTVNMPVDLADGALIAMTVGWNVDRTGKRSEDAVQPDEAVDPKVASAKAAAWLATQPACHTRSR